MGETGLLENFLRGFAKLEVIFFFLFFFMTESHFSQRWVAGPTATCRSRAQNQALEAVWLCAISFCKACRRQHSNFPRNVGNEALDATALQFSKASAKWSCPFPPKLCPAPAHLQLAELRLGLSISSEPPTSSSIETEKPLILLENMQRASLLQRGSKLKLGYLCGTTEVSAA